MTNIEKAIEMLMNGVSRVIAEEIIEQCCPRTFGIENTINCISCRIFLDNCYKCWNKEVEE